MFYFGFKESGSGKILLFHKKNSTGTINTGSWICNKVLLLPTVGTGMSSPDTVPGTLRIKLIGTLFAKVTVPEVKEMFLKDTGTDTVPYKSLDVGSFSYKKH